MEPPTTTQRDGHTTNPSIFLRLRDSNTQLRALSWEEFYRFYRPVIAGFARNVGVRGNAIDDVIQDVLLGFYKISPTFVYDPTRGFFRVYLKTATLTTISKHAAKNRLQLKGDLAEAADDERIDSLWELEWREGILSRALEEVQSKVERRTYEAFELYALKRVPAAEVASRLGLSMDSVYQAKKRVSSEAREIVSRIREEEG